MVWQLSEILKESHPNPACVFSVDQFLRRKAGNSTAENIF